MAVILFQGDSITDAGRTARIIELGTGYPHKVASKLGLDEPGEFQFYNRGISGNRIVDVYARIKADIINLKPDYMSIMIGVNDVWHEFNRKNGVATEKFEKIYNMLIEEIKEALPNIKIMIIEPYLLPESATHNAIGDESIDTYEEFRAETEKRAAAAKRVAEKNNLVFLPLQEKLDKLCEIQPVSYWAFDGVHPTNVGHEFIAREWIEAFNKSLR